MTEELIWDEVTLYVRDSDPDGPVIRLFADPYGCEEYKSNYMRSDMHPYASLISKHSIDRDEQLDWFYDVFLGGGEDISATPKRIVETAKALKGIADVSGCEFIVYPEIFERFGILIPANINVSLTEAEAPA